MNYAPLNFDKIYPVFKDAEAAYSGLLIFDWGYDPLPGTFKDMY